LKVLLITQYFPPDIGGVASRTSNIAKGLTLNGCEVTVITAFPHYPNGIIPSMYRWFPIKIEYSGKIKVIRTLIPPIKSEGFLKRLSLMGFFALSSLFAFPWLSKIDVVWGDSWVPGLVYSRINRIPIVLDVCDLTVEDMPMLKLADKTSLILRIASTIYRFFYVKGDAVAPISRGYVETIDKKYCVPRKKIHVIPVGVDTDVFSVGVSAKNEPARPFKVIYAGVIGVGYDFNQVFEAAQILKERGISVEFILHGHGECLQSIRDKINRLNLDNVKLSDKLLPSRKDVATFLSGADALLLPLKDYGDPYPGIPSKLYEYQSVGKPILCCAKGEPVKYILESNSGIVIKPQNPQALVEAIIQLSKDPELASTMGSNGRKYVEQNVALQAIGAKGKKLFEQVQSKKHS
jgi:colanic acid biosynthesis glycosyl transferase WcaI